MEEQISIVRQCELLGISRSGWYYQPVGESEEDLLLKRWIDEQYTLTPFLWESANESLFKESGVSVES